MTKMTDNLRDTPDKMPSSPRREKKTGSHNKQESKESMQKNRQGNIKLATNPTCKRAGRCTARRGRAEGLGQGNADDPPQDNDGGNDDACDTGSLPPMAKLIQNGNMT